MNGDYVIDNGILIKYNGSEKRITIPSNITSIGSEAFSNSLLQVVVFSKDVNCIESKAFNNCPRLKEVILPESLRIIRKKAFINCLSMRELFIPEGTECIDDEALNDCINLNYVYIPESMKVIGDEAFECNDRFHICGYKNSLAEEYAKMWELDFIAVDDFYNLSDDIKGCGCHALNLEITSIKINNACGNIVHTKYVDRGLIIETDTNKYLLDKTTEELLMFIDLTEKAYMEPILEEDCDISKSFMFHRFVPDK